LRFRRRAGALDVTYELLASDEPDAMQVAATLPTSTGPPSANIEQVIFRDTADDSAPCRFLRLRYVVSP
jgi:hypothetical protein